MATPEQERYSQALAEIAGRLDNLDNQAVRNMVEMLQNFRVQIADLILSAGDFEQYHLLQLRQQIADLIGQFEAQLTDSFARSLAAAQGLGVASINEPLAAIGLSGVGGVTAAQANVLVDFSASLIRNITTEMRSKIDGELRVATLAGKTPFQVMRSITKILGVNARDGVWGTRRRPEIVPGVAARAETIVRTELTRIYNLAHHSQGVEASKMIPGLTRRWLATGDERTRQSHLDVHRATAEKPIPVNKPFIVGGEKLMYPGDPAGSARETINCRCREQLIVPSVGVIETSLDKKITKEIRKREKATEDSA